MLDIKNIETGGVGVRSLHAAGVVEEGRAIKDQSNMICTNTGRYDLENRWNFLLSIKGYAWKYKSHFIVGLKILFLPFFIV